MSSRKYRVLEVMKSSLVPSFTNYGPPTIYRWSMDCTLLSADNELNARSITHVSIGPRMQMLTPVQSADNALQLEEDSQTKTVAETLHADPPNSAGLANV